MIAADIPVDIYRIWTHERVHESLSELKSWSYGDVLRANEWLDAIDYLERKNNSK